MLKRHEVQVLRRVGHTWKEIAALSGVSVRTVRRIAAEAAITAIDNAAERARRQVGGRRRLTRIATCSCRR
jgi:predicted transcriptional regulator